MVCKNCGNVIVSGTYCLRCGTENNERAQIEQLADIQKEIEVVDKNRYLRMALKIILVWVIIMIVCGITYNIMHSSFDSCVAVKGHDECGLGTLCDHECMPKGYFIVSFLTFFQLIAAVFIIPIILVTAIVADKIKNKGK